MNEIKIEVEIEDEKLLDTLFQTIEIEAEATKTDRGYTRITKKDNILQVKIIAEDYVAARAMTNSIMRLLKASVDVAKSITLEKKED